jgi:hypothetical protein
MLGFRAFCTTSAPGQKVNGDDASHGMPRNSDFDPTSTFKKHTLDTPAFQDAAAAAPTGMELGTADEAVASVTHRGSV